MRLSSSSHCSQLKLLGYDDFMALDTLSRNLLLTGYRFESFSTSQTSSEFNTIAKSLYPVTEIITVTTFESFTIAPSQTL